MNNKIFKPKNAQKKEPADYKSLYINEKLVKGIEKIAKDNNTSFNNVAITMKINLSIKKLTY